jgi:hypothetical protein
MTAGDIYTVAGDGTAGYAGDGGPAVQAELFSPEEVAVDRSGDLVIADGGNGAGAHRPQLGPLPPHRQLS